MKENLNLDVIKKLVEEKKISWTRHCLNRMQERNISVVDIKNAIYTGKIIEYYYNDYPFPSCLILGCSINKILIHIVCGLNKDCVYMITTYYPNENIWGKGMNSRRDK